MGIKCKTELIDRSLNVLDFQSHSHVGEMQPCRDALRPPVDENLPKPESEHQQIRLRDEVTLVELESAYNDLCTVFRNIEDASQPEMTTSQGTVPLSSGEKQPSEQRQSTRYFDQMVHFHCHTSPLFKVIFGRQRQEYVYQNQKIDMEVGDTVVNRTEKP